MSESKFQDLYKKLNKEQKEAVDSIEGPVMVVAGPGTGKTQILTLRIANILRKTDVPPDAILALTFTEAASYSMRKRLVEIIGPAGYRVNIFTFHGFANSIITSHPDMFERIIGASNINIIDQIKIMESIIDKTKLGKLKPFGNKYYYLRPVLSAISKLKRENISVKSLEKLIAKSKGAEKLQELHLLYKLYQEELRKNFLYDYDDMIMELVSVLEEDKDLLLELQETYQYILADEHQDANQAQNKILEMLASFYGNPNLFIVGDEKQAIFRFQGASLDNFEYFKKRFRDTKVITLTRNYRSKQYILEAASGIIPEGKLTSWGPDTKEGKVVVSSYEKVEDEIHALLARVEKLIKRGVAPSEIAVLYRDNKDALPVISVFEKSKIPFVVESDQDILSDQDLRKIILLMRLIESPQNQEFFAHVLHIDFLDIESLDIYKFLRNEGKSDSIKLIEKKIASWRKTSVNTDLVNFFEILVRESGFLNYILKKEDSVEKMNKLSTLFDEVKELVQNHRGYTLRDFLKYIDLIEEHNILLKKDRSPNFDAVRLMTAHRSKGQEFDHVFLIGATDDHWSSRKNTDLLSDVFEKAQSDGEERRLFYVALTRAREGVAISYHNTTRDGRNKLPSRFIGEIDPKLILREDAVSGGRRKLKQQKSEFEPAKKLAPSFKDKKYLKNLIAEREFSVTALNNYLKCPWRYFYTNLIRIPTALSKHQMYGIAVHSALRDLFYKKQKGEKVSSKILLESFKLALKRQAVSEDDYEEMLKKGSKALLGYFDTLPKTWDFDSKTEVDIKGVKIGDILLTGKIDRIDFLPGGGVRVIDYKTGKPKSRNEIIGKTGDRSGDYFRQLVFYKLLLDNFGDGKYRMVSGELDFIEPNDRGFYKKEAFEISDKDVEDLKIAIARAVKEIATLSFWNKNCGEPKCEYCGLREFLRQ